MSTIALDTKTTPQIVADKLAKKHIGAYSIATKEDTHCVLGHCVYGFVETEDESLMYSSDKAGRLRLVRSEKLTPTYKSIRLEPRDSVVRVGGNGQYAGLYVGRETVDGYYELTANIADVIPMRHSYAVEARNRIAFNSQYCYGGKFEVVKIV